ncbi:phosphoribosyltransferase family protein [Leptolyngbya sp. AN02str]|uniref:phosphoribosyltransferase family protein n=1 Tax=Leptolyngbya sp. AN02str TaxID=3423363 RepID=UPI003D315FCF
MTTERDRQLFQLIEQSGALQTGHFQLASGFHASRFFRCIKLFRNPHLAQPLFDAIAQRFADQPIQYVLGANEAGSILAFEVAKRLNAEVAIARQKSEHYSLIPGFHLQPGETVLIVDDITTTGGTVKQLIQITESAQAKPIGVGLIATKGLFQVELNYPTEVLITLENMDAVAPKDCPLCQANIPFTI